MRYIDTQVSPSAIEQFAATRLELAEVVAALLPEADVAGWEQRLAEASEKIERLDGVTVVAGDVTEAVGRRHFLHAGPPIELADVTGHTKASVRRSLHTLCHLGYATQDGRQFQLAARALRLPEAAGQHGILCRCLRHAPTILPHRAASPS